FELGGALEQEVALRLERLDLADEIADRVVARHLSPEAGDLPLRLGQLRAQGLVLLDQALGQLDPLPQELTNERLPLAAEVHRAVARALIPLVRISVRHHWSRTAPSRGAPIIHPHRLRGAIF